MKCNFAINTFSSPSRPIVKIPSRIKLLGAVFAPSFRHVLFSLRREIEGKCGPRSLDRIWSKEQRWQDHIFLAGVRLGLYLMSRQDSHYEPSVIGWKTAQLLNKVGSNEDLYRLTRDDIHWAEAGWLTWLHDQLEFLMTLRSSDSVSLHPASVQMSDQVSRQIPTTGSWIAVISVPGYLSGRNQGTDNTLLTTSQAQTAQWPVSHPTWAGRRN